MRMYGKYPAIHDSHGLFLQNVESFSCRQTTLLEPTREIPSSLPNHTLEVWSVGRDVPGAPRAQDALTNPNLQLFVEMELRHLKYFVAVAEEQNVTRAAARLHVSQPPLSRQIRDLEDELGVPLFERGAKSIRLTEAGRLFLTEARAVLERADQAAAAVKNLGSGLTGELNVGFAPSLAVDILPRALRNLQRDAPKIRVHLHDLSSDEMLTGLRQNKIDIALTIEQPAATLRGLHSQPLQTYKVCVALSPAHTLANKRNIRLADLAHERLLGYNKTEYPEFIDGLKRLPWPNKKVPPLAEEHDSVTSLIAAVEAGRGITIAPDSLSCLTGPRLKLLPITPAPPPFRVVATWRTLTPKSKRFLQAANPKANGLPSPEPRVAAPVATLGRRFYLNRKR